MYLNKTISQFYSLEVVSRHRDTQPQVKVCFRVGLMNCTTINIEKVCAIK